MAKTKTTTKKKTSTKKKTTTKKNTKATTKKNTTIYTLPVQYSISRVGLEVYKTDEKNFQPYQSVGAVNDTEKTDETEEDTKNNTFPLHQGAILETYYYNNLQSTENEADYKDMSDSGSFKTTSVDKKRFYKGVRVCLRKEWEAPGQTLQWNNLDPVLTGFITEQTFSETSTTVKLSGMTKLLEQNFKFDFKQMKRSKILAEIIKTAGLKPVINVKGLDDDVTDFSNLSSDGGSNSDLAGGEGEEIDSLVKKIVGSETNELKKAQLVHGWLKDNVRYSYYECTRHNTPEACLKNKGALNCADTARLTRSMMSSAGLDAWVVHRSSNNGHFWTLIKIDGKIYASDQTGDGSAWNTIWYSDGDRRTCDSRGGNWDIKNGKNPDC